MAPNRSNGLPDGFNELSIAANFDRATFARGRTYFNEGRVTKCQVDEDGRIHGVVKGSSGQAYGQIIVVSLGRSGFSITSKCSCPVGVNCKHVVAVLLSYISSDKSRADNENEFSLVAESTSRRDERVEAWLHSLAEVLAPDEYPPGIDQRLYYVLSNTSSSGPHRTLVDLVSAKILKDGAVGKGARLGFSGYRTGGLPKFVLPSDSRLIARLERGLPHDRFDQFLYRMEAPGSGALLPPLLASGRCRWESAGGPVLFEGNPRNVEIKWVDRPSGAQAIQIDVPDGIVLTSSPLWYVDPMTGECGPAETGIPEHVFQSLIQAPEVRPEVAERTRSALEKLLPDRPDILPTPRKAPIRRKVQPVPHLYVKRAECAYEPHTYYRRDVTKRLLPVARLEFDYAGQKVRADAEASEIRVLEGADTVIMPRQTTFEHAATNWLGEWGWASGRNVYGWKLPRGWGSDYVMPSDPSADTPWSVSQRYYAFLRAVPTLREKGWQVTVEDGFEVANVDETDWQIEAKAEGNDWFGLELGVLVDGVRIPLLPVLVQAIRTLMGSGRVRNLADAPDDMEIYHEMPGGKILVLPVSRIRPLVNALAELFGPMHEWPEDLKVSIAQASEVQMLDDAAAAAGLSLKAPDRLRELWQRLETFDQIGSVTPPLGLKGELRPYQAHGLAWLQFLREFGFSGILADDMGLGKTIQTLSHVLKEKEEGRLDRPVLIVAPTSTLPNWRQEAEKFAPSLRTLVLHGSGRSANFPAIWESDLVVTSFPLMVRDKEVLTAREFHIVVLDEAQNIKNPSTAAAKVAASLKARHRICLSGTPVENNLDELWSLFHFLMPGFLGGITQFRRRYRTPIEVQGDAEAKKRLARTTKPFILRRTKEQVATELPDKTEIIETIELDGPQRDLYESLRLAMDKRLRDLISSQGFERSQIQILEALLKLRQACCDPRLVKLETAKSVKGSAKLERLMEMLVEFRESGRRVLIFSQFTSMLDLIEEALHKEGMEWVRISGETKDRETPVRRFQAGEVPIFLISLKAGGTGLNLTAADTVIHYDPWWNPAVERQATDRAHRIGQTKAVFVFKLVAEGTVEEKILELQERKAGLAAAILGDDPDPIKSLTADDLKWIFEQ